MGKSPWILLGFVGVLAVAAGFWEFLGPAKGSTRSVADPAEWEIRFLSGRSKLLRRTTLQLIVVAKKRFNSADDGRVVRIGDHTLGGVGRLFLLEDNGELRECPTGIFDALWSQRESVQATITSPAGHQSRRIQAYLGSLLKSDPSESMLREFVGASPN